MYAEPPWVCVCAVPHFATLCSSFFPALPHQHSSCHHPPQTAFPLSQTGAISSPLEQQTSIQTTTTRQTSQHRLHEPIASTPSIVIIPPLLWSIRSLLRIIARLPLWSIALLPIISSLWLLIHLWTRRIISILSLWRVIPVWRVGILWRSAIRIRVILVGRGAVEFGLRAGVCLWRSCDAGTVVAIGWWGWGVGWIVLLVRHVCFYVVVSSYVMLGRIRAFMCGSGDVSGRVELSVLDGRCDLFGQLVSEAVWMRL